MNLLMPNDVYTAVATTNQTTQSHLALNITTLSRTSTRNTTTIDPEQFDLQRSNTHHNK
jgi:hypothetical protein